MSIRFQIAETETFEQQKALYKYSKLYLKIKDYIYPQLRNNPFFGTNIKKLKGELEKYHRYRIGNFRLFYMIDSEKKIVIITGIEDRKDAY